MITRDQAKQRPLPTKDNAKVINISTEQYEPYSCLLSDLAFGWERG